MFRYVEVQYKVLFGVLFNSWTLFYSKIGKMVTTKQEEEEEEKGEEEEEDRIVSICVTLKIYNEKRI